MSLLSIGGVFFVLWILVANDVHEKLFYSSGGVVGFTQYLLLSGSLLALIFSLRANWLTLIADKPGKQRIFNLFLSFPLFLLAGLLCYASLVLLAAA